MIQIDQGNVANCTDVIYLTNACGEETGYGSVELEASDFAKVAFEDGPGLVLPYIVEIHSVAHLLGNLEIAHQDEFWGEDSAKLESLADVRSYCERANTLIAKQMPPGALQILTDDRDPGRLTLGVAIPLKFVTDTDHAKELLSTAYGCLIEQPSLSKLHLALEGRTMRKVQDATVSGFTMLLGDVDQEEYESSPLLFSQENVVSAIPRVAENYWYHHRHDLESGMVFLTADGVVKLDRGVPGDATQWYAADWNDGWAYYDSTIEPGDLLSSVIEDSPHAIEMVLRYASESQQKDSSVDDPRLGGNVEAAAARASAVAERFRVLGAHPNRNFFQIEVEAIDGQHAFGVAALLLKEADEEGEAEFFAAIPAATHYELPGESVVTLDTVLDPDQADVFGLAEPETVDDSPSPGM